MYMYVVLSVYHDKLKIMISKDALIVNSAIILNTKDQFVTLPGKYLQKIDVLIYIL